MVVEFESADEFLGFYGIFRATVSDLVKEATRTFPVVAAAFMRGYLSFVLDRCEALPVVSVHCEGYAETESCVLFLEGVCVTATAGVDPNVVLSGELTALVECARCVLSWDPMAPLLMLNKMRCLSSVSTVLNVSAPLTTACFEYLFQMLSYESTIEDPTVEDQVMQVFANYFCIRFRLRCLMLSGEAEDNSFNQCSLLFALDIKQGSCADGENFHQRLFVFTEHSSSTLPAVTLIYFYSYFLLIPIISSEPT